MLDYTQFEFLQNDAWYTFDFDKGMCVLTEFAPDSAKESYQRYLEWKREDGDI